MSLGAEDSRPAVRDARAIADRIAADEAAADEERDRLRDRPLARLEADPDAAALLEPGESLIATARALPQDATPPGEGTPGVVRALLTTRRLLLRGPVDVRELRLRDIEEVAVIGERMLVIAQAGGREARLDMDHPRVFRVRLAHGVAMERAVRTT